MQKTYEKPMENLRRSCESACALGAVTVFKLALYQIIRFHMSGSNSEEKFETCCSKATRRSPKARYSEMSFHQSLGSSSCWAHRLSSEGFLMVVSDL